MKKRYKAILVGFIIITVLVSTSCSKTSNTSAHKTNTISYDSSLQRIVISVGNDQITSEYLVKRCLMNTSDIHDTMGMIQKIIQERIIEQVAAQSPYNVSVTEADIDQEIKDEANSTSSVSSSTTNPTSSTLFEAQNKNVYNQTLSQSLLTDNEFRELIKDVIMTKRLSAYLSDQMPPVSDQVHLYDMVLADSTTAQDVMNRIYSGEEFQKLAREMSLDTDTKTKGGDMGWIPLKALDSYLEQAAARLEIGQVSYPLQTSIATQAAKTSSTGKNDQPYYLLMVTEKDSNRETDTQYIPLLQSRLFDDWVNTQMDIQTIRLYGKSPTGGYDSETAAYLQYEIEKLNTAYGITKTTTTTIR